MPVWEYKIISSGKGGFATPAHLESFLNQLGKDEWEILAFHSQPENFLAISGLARRSTQRDWTLEDAAAAAARAEADKLRVEFEAKFRGMAASAAAGTGAPGESAPAEDPTVSDPSSYRRVRDTEHDQDPDAPEEAAEDEWDKLGGREEELPTFFEAIRPHMRRNQRGPGLSVGVDYLAKKWEFPEEDIVAAVKECGLEVPEDEDSKAVYIEYDGDLFWLNINRRGELWINTKEKPRPVFKTVSGVRFTPESESADPAGSGGSGEGAPAPAHRSGRHSERGGERGGERGPDRHSEPAQEGAAAQPLPEGPAILDSVRPLMRRNRREPGGSGSIQFLARGLKCSEESLVGALGALGLALPAEPGEKAPPVAIGEYVWWLNRDGRGGVWINAHEKREGEPAGGEGRESAPGASAGPASVAGESMPATGEAGSSETPAAATAASRPASADGSSSHVLAAARLLLRATRTGGVAATVDRIAGELGRSVDELVAALVGEGLRVPDKAREKPVFVEHAGEIFWFNRNVRGELWLNAKSTRLPEDGEDDAAGGAGARGGRRPGRRGPVAKSDPAATDSPGTSEGPATDSPEGVLPAGEPVPDPAPSA